MKKLLFSLVLFGTIFITLFVAARLSGAQEDNNNDEKIKPEAIKQMQALAREKQSRTSTQKKIDSRLLFKIKIERNEMIADGVTTLETGLTVDDRGYIDIEITAYVTKKLLAELRRINAEIIVSLPQYRSLTASVPIASIESLAGMDEVIFIMPKQEAMFSRENKIQPLSITNDSIFKLNRHLALNRAVDFEARAQKVRNFIALSLDASPGSGSVNSQGDTTHASNTFRATTGSNGAGIKIGVLSDGVNSLPLRQATGDLPVVNVLSGQAGSGDEGTAMLEIVYDVAPGAQLYFATANPSPAQFAQNIRNLRAAGCTIIIDDVSYFFETPFQNGQAGNVISTTNGGVVVQAVNDVTIGSQSGAIYFSSAGNSGNKNDNTSGAWEGDFVDAGPAGGILTGAGNLHNFGGTIANTITSGTNAPIILKWSDPLGASANDYDLFVLNSTGTAVLAVSNGVQDGTQDPLEGVSNTVNTPGNIIVVTRYSGANRFLHLNTNRGRLAVSTSGVVYGHNAGINTISIAATPTGPATIDGIVFGPFPGLFNSGNKVERFSSDGPRRIFYNSNSTAITPGNVSSTGGQLLQKPDITAADGVSTTTPGFIPFWGTSAAAPHAGALAALLKSACPASTNTQLVSAMKATAIDIEAAGMDRDSGAGIFMPIPARTALCSCGSAAISIGQTVNGTLQSGDCLYTDNSFYDAYTFNGTAGQQIYITLNSTQFNAYLFLFQGNYPGGTFLAQDNDGGGGTNARIPATSGFLTLPATGTYTILANSLTAGEAGNYTLFLGTNVISPRKPFDYDGDGRADISVFRPVNGSWYITNSSNGSLTAVQFGANGDLIAPADFDGDGRTDICVFRPLDGSWYRLNSSNNTFTGIQFGANGDLPAPGDFDGDTRADITVYRPSAGSWYRLNSSNGQFIANQFGIFEDKPIVGDFDGDGRNDLAVWRPSNGTWYRINSSTGQFVGAQFGSNGDKPVAADYDGDGRADLGVYRPSNGTWYVIQSSNGAFIGTQFGIAEDRPAPADFDGDNRADRVVFRPSNGTWYLLRSSAGFTGTQFGTFGDVPTPNAFVR